MNKIKKKKREERLTKFNFHFLKASKIFYLHNYRNKCARKYTDVYKHLLKPILVISK